MIHDIYFLVCIFFLCQIDCALVAIGYTNITLDVVFRCFFAVGIGLFWRRCPPIPSWRKMRMWGSSWCCIAGIAVVLVKSSFFCSFFLSSFWLSRIPPQTMSKCSILSCARAMICSKPGLVVLPTHVHRCLQEFPS